MTEEIPVNGLAIWVIYDHPEDFPKHWVVRRQWGRIVDGKPAIEYDSAVYPFKTVDGARAMLTDFGLVCLGRTADDDPSIVESWV